MYRSGTGTFPVKSIIKYPTVYKTHFNRQAGLAALGNVIGNTPMLVIYYSYKGLQGRIFAKCEYANHTGSIKDRMALHIIREAYNNGELEPGMPIIEVSSGNTGISFAAIGKKFGNPVKVIMPDWLSTERKLIIRSYGAEVIEVSKEMGGFTGSMKLAQQMAEQLNAFLPNQFSNQANEACHEKTTGPEIWEQLRMMGVLPDAFVAGVGSGGTVMGVGKFLKSKRVEIGVHPLEPAESPTLTTGHKTGHHRIQGISDEFIPELLKLDRLDRIVQVNDGDAILMAQKFAAQTGIGIGISSGANLIGAMKLHAALGTESNVVTVIADCNKKYFSTGLMQEEPARDAYVSPDTDILGYNVVPRLTPSR